MNKSTILSVFVVLISSTFAAQYLLNDLLAVSASVAYSKNQLMPFEMKEIFETGQAQNEPTKNSSTIGVGAEDNTDKTTNCEMPPCPHGQACIQSCP